MLSSLEQGLSWLLQLRCWSGPIRSGWEPKNNRVIFNCRKTRKDRSYCVIRSLCMDLVCNPSSIFYRRLPIWHKWAVLVSASASILVMIFTILAMELKRKAPSSHTFPEMIYARFGKHSHKISCSLPS